MSARRHSATGRLEIGGRQHGPRYESINKPATVNTRGVVAPGMRVAVGSTNPVKVEATERALAPLAPTAVVPVAVESGVSDQPMGHGETRSGSRRRAERALAVEEADLGIGIEGGVHDRDGLFLIMWATVTDGTRTGAGSGPSLALPADIAARVRAGEELGPVMDDVLDTEGVKHGQGAAGALTEGHLTRSDALTAAVTAAAGPWLSSLYDAG